MNKQKINFISYQSHPNINEIAKICIQGVSLSKANLQVSQKIDKVRNWKFLYLSRDEFTAANIFQDDGLPVIQEIDTYFFIILKDDCLFEFQLEN